MLRVTSGFLSQEKTSRVLLSALFVLAASLHANGHGIFFEDFESLNYGPAVDEVVNDNLQEGVYSPVGPEGWTVDRTNVPVGGVLEFSGWNFLDPAWWSSVAGDQGRAPFVTTGEGVVAVADGDEWDDAFHEPGNMNTFLKSPPIAVSPGDVDLQFDSSFRPDGTQEAQVRAVFDVGDPVELLHWYSSEEVGGPLSEDGLFGFFPDPPIADDIVNATIPVPAGASTVSLEFGYLNAGNHWWWAVDNIAVGDNYFEDFESTELGPNLDEGRAPPEFVGETATVWTDVPPAGWVIDDSGVPGVDLDDPANDGVTEWAGWSFANKDWWVLVAGDQSRSLFTSGEGGVLIADPDEWDDQQHPSSADNGWYQTTIDTPSIPLDDIEAGDELIVQFDSSWRPEFDDNYRQSGRLVAKFSNGEESELFEWRSAEGNVTEEFLGGSDEVANTYANGDKINDEDLAFLLTVPEGAESFVLQFEMFDAGNDWWWAIDNLEVIHNEEEACNPNTLGDLDGNGTVEFADFLVLAENFGSDATDHTTGDIDCNGKVEFSDFLVLAENFGATTGEASSVPEPSGFSIVLIGLVSACGIRRRRR